MAIPQVQDPSVRYLSTSQAYDLWADVYDTDGNFLQALDTVEMRTLVPKMLSLLRSPKPWKLVDLGCGTGRNTAALLEVEEATVVGLDVSQGMLDVARQRLGQGLPGGKLRLEKLDMIEASSPPSWVSDVDAVVSTLVLEHVPADDFFNHVSTMLRPGGVLLLTNMHAEMGAISQAGFVDPNSGEKIRPTSYAHTIANVKESATKHGLDLIGKVEERTVDQTMVSQLGRRSGKWVGVAVWVGAMFQKK
jgi:cyclopropane fatty-acyl-phospholipid synthase-like methyltransferase